MLYFFIISDIGVAISAGRIISYSSSDGMIATVDAQVPCNWPK